MLLVYVLLISTLVFAVAFTADVLPKVIEERKVLRGIDNIGELKPAPKPSDEVEYYHPFDFLFDNSMARVARRGVTTDELVVAVAYQGQSARTTRYQTIQRLSQSFEMTREKPTGSHRRGRLDNFTRKVYGL